MMNLIAFGNRVSLFSLNMLKVNNKTLLVLSVAFFEYLHHIVEVGRICLYLGQLK